MGCAGREEMGANKKIAFYILAGVLFLSPLFKGLFFKKEMLITGIVVAILFIWDVWSDRGAGIKSVAARWEIIDLGLVGLLLAYLISTVTALKMQDAVIMDLKVAIYLMVFIIAAGLSVKVGTSRKILVVAYAAGVTVALVGLAAYGGASVQDGVLVGRIGSTFQYANALGAYLSAIGIIGCYLLITAKNRWVKCLIAAGNVTVFAALFGTASRGAFLVLALVYIIYIVLQRAEQRLQTFGTLSLGLVLGGTAAYFMGGKAGSPGIWMFVVLAAVLGALISLGSQRLDTAIITRNKKLKYILLIIFLAVVVGMGVKAAPQTGFLNRITNISLQDRNLVERGYFYRDAFKIIRDYPIVGVGGGGWANIYLAYQSYGYTATQVHNFYLQALVETGVIGSITVFAVLAGVALCFIKIRRKGNPDDYLMAVTVLAGILVIGLQSAIDFTLSYGAIGIMMWMFFGMLRGNLLVVDSPVRKTAEVEAGTPVGLLAGTVVALIVAVVSFSLLMGMFYEGKALDALKKRDYEQRTVYLERSRMFNPFLADTYANMALTENALYRVDRKKEHLTKSLDYINKSISRNKGTQAFRIEKVSMLLTLKDYETANKEAQTAFLLAPWNQNSYNFLAWCYMSTGQAYMKAGDKKKAIEYFRKTISVPQMIIKRMNSLSEQEKKLWIATPHLKFDKNLQKMVSKAIIYQKKLL